MHQIISGEIHKKNIFKFDLENFYNKNKKLYHDILSKNILFNEMFFSENIGYNFLSINNIDAKEDSHFKAILKKEYYECEKLYPYLGNMFLNNFFKKNTLVSKKSYIVNKKIIENLLNKEKNCLIKDIVKTYIANCTLEYNVSIEKSYTSEIVLEKNNNMIFKNYYDLDFFNSNKKHEYNNYKIFLIDGYIQSVGEIHHILQKSNEENIPFVIFCYGMNSDVKNTIIVNNKNKKTQVYPLSFEYNEDNLNIFNDIALIHGSDVISANNGQTISSAARKEFKTGKRIVIIPNSNCFIIEPVVDFKNIKQHINMLRSKINNKKLSETSKKNTIRRFKSLNSKNFKIFLPEKLINDYNFISRIHFYFSFLSKLNLEQKKVKFKNEIYFFPLIYLEYAKEKSKSLLDIFKNIEYGIEEI